MISENIWIWAIVLICVGIVSFAIGNRVRLKVLNWIGVLSFVTGAIVGVIYLVNLIS